MTGDLHLVDLGEIRPGSILVLRTPVVFDADDMRRVHDDLAARVGHSKFALVQLHPTADLSVIGPDVARDLLRRLEEDGNDD